MAFPVQAAFLLPWRRVFNLSDSQLFVARRENAKALFRGFIDSRGGTLQARTPSQPAPAVPVSDSARPQRMARRTAALLGGRELRRWVTGGAPKPVPCPGAHTVQRMRLHACDLRITMLPPDSELAAAGRARPVGVAHEFPGGLQPCP